VPPPVAEDDQQAGLVPVDVRQPPAVPDLDPPKPVRPWRLADTARGQAVEVAGHNATAHARQRTAGTYPFGYTGEKDPLPARAPAGCCPTSTHRSSRSSSISTPANGSARLPSPPGSTTTATTPAPAAPWSPTTVRGVLRNRAYLGEVTFRGQRYDADHQPLIAPDVFDAAQALLAERGEDRAARRSNPSDYLLAFEAGTLPERVCGDRLRELGTTVARLRGSRDDLIRRIETTRPTDPTADELAALRAHIRHVIANGSTATRKALLRALVHEIRVDARDHIQPVFRVPVSGFPTNPTQDTPEDTKVHDPKVRALGGDVEKARLEPAQSGSRGRCPSSRARTAGPTAWWRRRGRTWSRGADSGRGAPRLSYVPWWCGGACEARTRRLVHAMHALFLMS
jgi:hypothetical protein